MQGIPARSFSPGNFVVVGEVAGPAAGLVDVPGFEAVGGEGEGRAGADLTGVRIFDVVASVVGTALARAEGRVETVLLIDTGRFVAVVVALAENGGRLEISDRVFVVDAGGRGSGGGISVDSVEVECVAAAEAGRLLATASIDPVFEAEEFDLFVGVAPPIVVLGAGGPEIRIVLVVRAAGATLGELVVEVGKAVELARLVTGRTVEELAGVRGVMAVRVASGVERFVEREVADRTEFAREGRRVVFGFSRVFVDVDATDEATGGRDVDDVVVRRGGAAGEGEEEEMIVPPILELPTVVALPLALPPPIPPLVSVVRGNLPPRVGVVSTVLEFPSLAAALVARFGRASEVASFLGEIRRSIRVVSGFGEVA